MMDPTVELVTSKSFRVAAVSMCGQRAQMEDAHTVMLERVIRGKRVSYVAVFDGHGGDHTAKWAANNLHDYVLRDPFNHAAVKQAFLDADTAYAAMYPDVSRMAGCTVAMIVITRMDDAWRVVTAHAGDSRVIIVDGQNEFTTEDHKPENPEEKWRIHVTGGHVSQLNWYGTLAGPMRTNGDLSLSRALGDYRYKETPGFALRDQAISPEPDVREYRVQDTARIVIACDGVFEALDNADAISIIRSAPDGDAAAFELVCEAYTAGSTDNISAVCITMNPAPPELPQLPAHLRPFSLANIHALHPLR